VCEKSGNYGRSAYDSDELDMVSVLWEGAMRNTVVYSIVLCMACTLFSGCGTESQFVQTTPVFTFLGMVADETEDGFVFWGVEPYESAVGAKVVYCDNPEMGVLMDSVMQDIDKYGFSARSAWYPLENLVLTLVTFDDDGLEVAEEQIQTGFLFVDTRPEYSVP
jgi:hypothetical protein